VVKVGLRHQSQINPVTEGYECGVLVGSLRGSGYGESQKEGVNLYFKLLRNRQWEIWLSKGGVLLRRMGTFKGIKCASRRSVGVDLFCLENSA